MKLSNMPSTGSLLARTVTQVLSSGLNYQSNCEASIGQAVAEGLAKLAGGLPPDEAATAGMTIISPTLQRLQQLINSSGAAATGFPLLCEIDEKPV